MNVYCVRRPQASIDDLSFGAGPRLTCLIVKPTALGPQSSAYGGPWWMDSASPA